MASAGVRRARNWPLGAPRVERAARACHSFCEFLAPSTAGGGRGRDEREEEGEIERQVDRDTETENRGGGWGELPDRGRGGGERGRGDVGRAKEPQAIPHLLKTTGAGRWYRDKHP